MSETDQETHDLSGPIKSADDLRGKSLRHPIIAELAPIISCAIAQYRAALQLDIQAQLACEAAVIAAALAWHELPIHSNIRALQAACVALKATKLTPPPETL